MEGAQTVAGSTRPLVESIPKACLLSRLTKVADIIPQSANLSNRKPVWADFTGETDALANISAEEARQLTTRFEVLDPEDYCQ